MDINPKRIGWQVQLRKKWLMQGEKKVMEIDKIEKRKFGIK